MHKAPISPTSDKIAALSIASKRQGHVPNLSQETESPFVLAYLRFLSRIETEQDKHPAALDQPLDPNEKALLEMVILRWAQQATMTVRQTIAHAHLGSPATLHKRLTLLRKKGFLRLEDVEGDKRAKYLVPGPQGFVYLESMGKHMVSAKRKGNKPLG
jgi:DNA-binding MarR family transcriptional regulator